MKIEDVWEDILEYRSCGECPLKGKTHPLLFKPKSKVKVMVVTEGPNEEAEPEFIASIANHPTFTFLQALFRGNFQSIKRNANAYWTHLRKCFLKTKERDDFSRDKNEALKICSAAYLKREIENLKPKLIVAVGNKAKNFFSGYDKRICGSLTQVLFEKGGILNNIEIEEIIVDIVVTYHPSGRNPFWAKLPGNAKDVMENISSKIVENL